MSAWATNQMIQVGGLYRVRYTGLPLHLPVTLAATQTGIELTFSDPLDKASAENPANFEITTWDLKRSHNYGSKRYNVQQLKISKAKLDEDGKLLRIALPDIQPTWVMEIKYHLEATDGKPVEGIIQNTIYTLEKTTALDM